MPIYDYHCLNCRRRVSLFYRTLSAATVATAVCPHCQSHKLRRLVSKVAVVKSEDARLDAMSDSDMLDGLDEEDPRSMGRMMRRMSDELGEEMDPEFDEVIDRLESGQPPEEIEKAMPDLAGDGSGAGGGGFDDFE
jgi:putative FmdB family regulatory protein